MGQSENRTQMFNFLFRYNPTNSELHSGQRDQFGFPEWPLSNCLVAYQTWANAITLTAGHSDTVTVTVRTAQLKFNPNCPELFHL